MSETPIEIDVLAVEKLLSEGKIALIDCREESEWEVARINGASLMPMSRWLDESPKLQAYAGQQIVVHCHHGSRSLRIANWMRANGFPTAQNMTGGIDAWSQRVDSRVPRY